MFWNRSPTSRIGIANFGIDPFSASSCACVSASGAAIAGAVASASKTPAKAAPIVFLNIRTPSKFWDLPNAVVLDCTRSGRHGQTSESKSNNGDQQCTCQLQKVLNCPLQVCVKCERGQADYEPAAVLSRFAQCHHKPM